MNHPSNHAKALGLKARNLTTNLTANLTALGLRDSRSGRRCQRRLFLRRFGMGWLVVAGMGAGFGAVTGCGKPTQSGFRNVGSLKLLLEEGKIFDEHFSSEPLLVVRGPQKKGSKELGPIAALSPTCSHQKCLVNWDKAQESFVCPCHQSRFDLTGKNLQGPAKENLKTYPIEIRGEEIWVADRFQ
jgi:cytochrome b6-f complex iron-sulfur subunit